VLCGRVAHFFGLGGSYVTDSGAWILVGFVRFVYSKVNCVPLILCGVVSSFGRATSLIFYYLLFLHYN